MPERDFNGSECRPEFKNKEMVFAPFWAHRRCFDPHPVRMPRAGPIRACNETFYES